MFRLLSTALLAVILAGGVTAAQEPIDQAMVARIKEEGLQRWRGYELLLTLSDQIGSRLTGSPEYNEAARWARDRFAEFGLANAHLESFEFGRGWTLEKISVEMTGPRYMPLIAYAEAWTPSIPGIVTGRVIYVGDKTQAEIEALGTQLRGAIVATHLPQARFIDTDRGQHGLSHEPIRT